MKILARYYVDEEKNIDLSDCSTVEFGEGQDRISVCVRDGVVEVRSVEGRVNIQPIAANVFEIKHIL